MDEIRRYVISQREAVILSCMRLLSYGSRIVQLKTVTLQFAAVIKQLSNFYCNQSHIDLLSVLQIW